MSFRFNMKIQSFSLLLFIFFGLIPPLAAATKVTIPKPISGRPVTVVDIIPADVLSRVVLVRHELEKIRTEMGKPKDRQEMLVVKTAAPHVVYFQALTLFRKANRLSFDLYRNKEKDPDIVETAQIRPYHVYQMVNRALKQILIVKNRMRIPEVSVENELPDTVRPAQVFQEIVQVNRQLNLLLDQQFTPSDVYQQTTLAISFAARILAHFPHSERIPAQPKYERKKKPTDVFKQLLDCYDILRKIAEKSKIAIVELDHDILELEGVKPSDTYDIMSLLVSELAFMHGQTPNADPPNESYYPGRKFPSDVYQRVGILKKQLQELQRWVRSNPTWLQQAER